MSKTILVAVAMIAGGVLANKSLVAFSVEPGEELTKAKIEKLGLTSADLDDLKAKGSIAEIDVRQAEAESAVDDKALKAAIARAEKAEGEVAALTEKIAALEKDLADATAPAAAGQA